MDADSWSARLSSATKRYQSARPSRSEMFMGFEEMDGDDEIREEFPCPFCSEYYDIIGLCCHIDEVHPVEAKNGRKRKSRKSGSQTTLSLLRKELREGNFQSLFGCSSRTVSSSNTAPDPLLTSFIMPMAEDHVSVQPILARSSSPQKSSSDISSERTSVQSSALSRKDVEEKAKRCEFVQGLLLSSIFTENF